MSQPCEVLGQAELSADDALDKPAVIVMDGNGIGRANSTGVANEWQV